MSVPTPPTGADAQQVLEQLWLQVPLDPALSSPPRPGWRLCAGGVPPEPLYRWRLQPRLVWVGQARNRERARWPDRRRLTRDPTQEGTLGLKIGWGGVGRDAASDRPDEQQARDTSHLHARRRKRRALLVGGLLLLLLVGLVWWVVGHPPHLVGLWLLVAEQAGRNLARNRTEQDEPDRCFGQAEKEDTEMDRTAIAEALQRDHVLAWLDSHQPAATVGTARRADDCPLARYVRAQTGQDVRVSQEAVSEPDEAEAGRVGAVLVELDRWAKWFTRLVDWGFPAKGQVTATEAKAVLERASKRTSDPVPCETEGCPSAYALLAGFCL